MPIKVTSLSKLSVILLLLKRPRHGYELIKEIREKFGFTVSAGQIYPFLFSLVRAKFIAVEKKTARDKKVYTLTSKGRAFARRVVESLDEVIELAISKKVHRCSHCGCKVLGKAHAEKIGRKKTYFCCASCAESFSLS